MKHGFLLAWRYVRHTPGRSLVLSVGIALTLLLPLALQGLVDEYSLALEARAQATPLVAGAKGSRYDLVLSSLYFTGRTPETTSLAEVQRLEETGLVLPVPLLARSTASDAPVVGTSHDYFTVRSLRAERGSLPLRLGDAVLGAEVAERLGIEERGHLLSDQNNLYDLSKAYPLRMRVTGVLAPTGSADDQAVFTSLETAWIIEGLGHGHQDASEASDEVLIKRDGESAVFNPAVVEYTEITEANIESFHFHAEPEDLPLTGILVLPKDAKSSTQVKARYRVSETAQLLVPTEVIEELLGFVFQLKVFFDANALLVLVATALFLGVVVLVSLEARRGEMRTLARIGCARGTVTRLFATELLLLTLFGLLLAGLAAGLASIFAPSLTDLLNPQ